MNPRSMEELAAQINRSLERASAGLPMIDWSRYESACVGVVSLDVPCGHSGVEGRRSPRNPLDFLTDAERAEVVSLIQIVADTTDRRAIKALADKYLVGICRSCHGTGSRQPPATSECPACGGSGRSSIGRSGC